MAQYVTILTLQRVSALCSYNAVRFLSDLDGKAHRIIVKLRDKGIGSPYLKSVQNSRV
jgi:hypothetical protein